MKPTKKCVPQRNNIKMATRMMIENSKISDVIVKASAFTSDPSKVRAAREKSRMFCKKSPCLLPKEPYSLPKEPCVPQKSHVCHCESVGLLV